MQRVELQRQLARAADRDGFDDEEQRKPVVGGRAIRLGQQVQVGARLAALFQARVHQRRAQRLPRHRHVDVRLRAPDVRLERAASLRAAPPRASVLRGSSPTAVRRRLDPRRRRSRARRPPGVRLRRTGRSWSRGQRAPCRPTTRTTARAAPPPARRTRSGARRTLRSPRFPGTKSPAAGASAAGARGRPAAPRAARPPG